MKQKFIIISPTGWLIMIFSALCTAIVYFSKYQQTCNYGYDSIQQEVALRYLKKKQFLKVEKLLGKGCQYSTDKEGEQVIIWNSTDTNNQIRVLLRNGKVIKYDVAKQ